MILLDCDDLCRCGGMVDAIDSKSIIRKDVEVRVLSSALEVRKQKYPQCGVFLFVLVSFYMQRLIVICGPTATGKSDYAVQLAKQLAKDGIKSEIISADSRQVYKGLDIGSGKITVQEMEGIPHHLLDVASPKRTFTVAQYKKLADKAIKDIVKRNKVPIIVGGTGFYIDAVVFNQQFPEVGPNKALRKSLERLSLDDLRQKLQELDIERYQTIDIHNRVRMIRAIEIAAVLGKVPVQEPRTAKYAVEWIYIDLPDDVLKERIHDRLLKRMKQGMVTEIAELHAQGLSWKRLEALGLEYGYVAMYLQEKLSKEEMLIQLEAAIWQYVKRQRAWFKKYAK
ncbi:MAG: miaA [Candidatus Nomurabacteria bacterium]|nr:miaA [Candidatus Nomurabacteria bacterium]